MRNAAPHTWDDLHRSCGRLPPESENGTGLRIATTHPPYIRVQGEEKPKVVNRRYSLGKVRSNWCVVSMNMNR